MSLDLYLTSDRCCDEQFSRGEQFFSRVILNLEACVKLVLIMITILMFLLGQTIQALSISMLLEVLTKLFHPAERAHSTSRTDHISYFWHGTVVLSIALFFLLINSLLQIAVWAASFFFVGQFPNYWDAFYHSAVNFATLGYGDIVMKPPWRFLGAMEAISGVLMLGLSTATLSYVFTKLMQLRRKR